jgi:DNA-directed RNA polymerase subunit RPC12/RpoP
MTTIALELKTACGACGDNVPLNGVVDQISCPRCRAPIRFDAAAWRQILEAPALEGPREQPDEQNAGFVRAARPVMRVFTRRAAACARCATALPLPQALEHAERGWCACVACGERVSVRPAPASVAGMGGLTHLVGEDLSQIAGGAAHVDAGAATTVRCGHCGAALPVDRATSRATACTYCNASVVLPDDVWARLHPLPEQRAWFLVLDTARLAAGAAAGPTFEWENVEDFAVGGDGNLYFVGTSDIPRLHGNRVWSCDARFALRWTRHGLPLDDGERLRITPTYDGHVLVSRRQKHSVVKLSCADGATVAVLGGPEPPDARAHGLDLEYAEAVAADPDGSIVAALHNRLLRWSADGAPVETWPPARGFFGEKHQKLGPLFRTDPNGERGAIRPDATATPETLKDRPVELRSSVSLAIGPDGAMYLQRGKHVVKLARDGKKVWLAELADEGSDMDRPRVDAQGNVYLLRWLETDTHGIVRISPDGKDVRLLVDGRKPGTPMCAERHFAVAAGGTIFVVGSFRVARVFGADGSARLASPAARQDDEQHAREVARRGQ